MVILLFSNSIVRKCLPHKNFPKKLKALIIGVMRRKMLLAVGLLGLGAVSVLLIVLFANSSGRATACQNLIYGMERGEVEETYAMLSDPAQNHVPIDEWAEQVDFVQRMFAGRENAPELIDSIEETAAFDGGKATTETYRVESKFGPWEASCTLFESADGKIGSFRADIGI